MTWFIAFLGILASFIVKFLNRKDKKAEPSMMYWLKDNIWECVVSFIFMTILLIIGSKTEFNEEAFLAKFPLVKSLPIDLIVSALIGYFNNVAWYALIKKLKGK